MKPGAFALAFALVLVATPGASADSFEIIAHARSGEYDSASTQEGDLSVLHIGFRDNTAPSSAWPWLEGTAAHVSAVQYSRERTQVDVAGLTPYNEGQPTESAYESDDCAFRLTQWESEYVVNVFGDAGIGSESRQSNGQYVPFSTVWMDEAGIVGAGPAVSDADVDDFTPVQVRAPLVRHQASGDTFITTLTGNFTMEIRGWDLHMEGAGGSRDLSSGVKDEGVQPSPSMVDDPVRTITTQFLRVEFTGAHLRLQVEGGGALIQTGFEEITAIHDGTLDLDDVNGDLGGDALSQGGAVKAGLPVVIASSMAGDSPRLEVTRAPVSDTTAPGPLAAVAVALPGFLFLGIPAMIGVGLLVYLLRREHLPTDLKTVEALLEKGRYTKAASIAGRILKYNPGKEDAMISRAVALSKDRRHGKVIEEVERHLKVHKPTDGVLHYVLGLSYLDLGRKAPGEDALHEAVRLTPGLRPEVTARLGVPAPVHHQEAHGYA